MRDNIRHAITVGECSMVVEAKNHTPYGWGRRFSSHLKNGYSIFRMIETIMNSRHYPIQGYEYWTTFARRRYE